MRPITTRTLIAVAVLALTGGACSADAAKGEKAGGDAEPVTLRIGTVGNPQSAQADEIEHFADAVEGDSDGSLVVDIVYEVGHGDADAEHTLASMVTAGEIDLALVPTRAWTTRGVTSFDALRAPFLVDDLGLLGAIAHSDIATVMLEGLSTLSVEGLAMWPESLRHPVSFGDPLLTASDFKGITFRTSTPVDSNMVAAIGAEPVNEPMNPEDIAAAVGAGDLDGEESAFIWVNELPRYGVFTANITFYAKSNVIVANSDVFDALSDDQQNVMRREATATIDYVIDTTSERDLAAQYCADGGSVVLADDADVAGLVQLTEPVRAEMAKDADTAQLLDEIRALKADRPAGTDVPEACQPVIDEPVVVSNDEGFPEGVYRAEGPYGIVTFEFRGGTWNRYLENGDLDCVSTYSVKSGRISLRHSTERRFACGGVPGGVFLTAAWTLEGDQLRLLDIRGSDPDVEAEFALPWTMIE